MSIAEVDLTLGSLFASEENPGLMFATAREYYSNNNAEDGDNRILKVSKRPNIINKLIRQIKDITVLSDNSGNEFVYECSSFHVKLFDENPKWYFKIDPYAFMYSEDLCDRCGKRINLINSTYSLCDICDSEMYIEQWSNVI